MREQGNGWTWEQGNKPKDCLVSNPLACFPVPMLTHSPVLSFKIQNFIVYLLHILGYSQGQEAQKGVQSASFISCAEGTTGVGLVYKVREKGVGGCGMLAWKPHFATWDPMFGSLVWFFQALMSSALTPNTSCTVRHPNLIWLCACLPFVTRTSIAGMAPIHFLPRSCLLPIPWGLCTHTHAMLFLVDHTLTLPFLVIFPLIIFLLTCTISACQISGSLPLCSFHLTGTHLIISWTPFLTISPWHRHPLPLSHSQSVTQSLLPLP